MKSPLRRKASVPAEARPHLQTVLLEGGLGLAVNALTAGLELMSSDWPDEDSADWPVYDSGLRLARQIAHAAVGQAGAPDDAALRDAARAHYEHVSDLRHECLMEAVLLDDYQPAKDVLGFTSAVLREQTLEHHTTEIVVGTDADGRRLLATMAVSVQQAHVWLSGALYEKVEAWAARDPLISLERRASAWWLDRWRSARPLPGDEFARGVREQEFSLVDRPLRCLHVSVMEHLLEEGLLRRIGPRQQHMAAQLLESHTGVWTVEERTEGRAVLVAAWDNARYEVREHAGTSDNPYRPGFLAVGTLIPFGDGTWLRSPGMLMTSFGRDGRRVARKLMQDIASLSERMPVAAVLEAAMHTFAGVRGLPRTVGPVSTPDEAANMAREVTALLRASGIAQPAAPESAMAQHLSRTHGGEVLEYDTDIPLGEYLQALFQQSMKSRAVREVRQRKERQARKKGRRR
jgi:hypothetical protein